jgi:uncharacterized membrane protein
MSRFMKVDGLPGFVRDKNSGAIVNINKTEAAAARKRKHERLRQKEEIQALKDDVHEIKNMLKQILER